MAANKPRSKSGTKYTQEHARFLRAARRAELYELVDQLHRANAQAGAVGCNLIAILNDPQDEHQLGPAGLTRDVQELEILLDNFQNTVRYVLTKAVNLVKKIPVGG